MSNGQETIRVAEGQLIALSNVHPGVWGAVKEVYANAEGYASDKTTPYCDAVLVDENNPDRAYLYFSSHSYIAEPEHVFDLGHLGSASAVMHRKFNIGTYITAGKLCRVGKTGMTVISFDPATNTGLVMRAYVGDDGYVCKVNPAKITIDSKSGKPVLFTANMSAEQRNVTERLWLGTRWEVGEFNQGASHAAYCQMLWDTTIKHAREYKKHATTTFLYTHLKTWDDDGYVPSPLCFLMSTHNDILERESDSPAYGFRNTIREHFAPCINNMPLVSTDLKKRMFKVMGTPVNINSSGNVDAPWIARVSRALNLEPRIVSEWYNLCGGKVMVKFANVEAPAQQILTNFKHYARHICGVTQALPVGACVLHGDKHISASPFALHEGRVFQLRPEASTLWEPLANALLLEGRATEKHVDKLWEIMGVPSARLEIDPKATPEQRATQLKINSDILRVDDTGTKGYKYVSKLIVRPTRKARTLVDVAGVKDTTGVFNLKDYLDEKKKEKNYLDKEAVSEARVAGTLADDIDFKKRIGVAALLGLTTAAVVQVGNLEQPMDKEHLLENADSKRLYKDFYRCLVHHVLCHPTSEVVKIRDAFLDKWREAEADAIAEDKDVAWIKAEFARRTAAEEKKKKEAHAAAQKKAAEEERKRIAAEKKADDEKKKREELERRTADGQRVSDRHAREDAAKEAAVLDAIAKAAEKEAAAARKEAALLAREAARELQKQEQERLREEKNQQKAKSRQNRGKVAESVFSTAVANLIGGWGWPEQMRVDASDISSKGDLLPRSKATETTARITEGHQAIEAVAYAFETESLQPGNKRKLESWVSGDMAKKMLQDIMEDDRIVKSLGLEFNWHNKVGKRKMPVTIDVDATVATPADAQLPELPASAVVSQTAQPPRKKQRGTNNDEAASSASSVSGSPAGAAGADGDDDITELD